ncbi:unnamed protein product [Rotaria magnacalcarata]|uniref:Uncharacterized protein n=1 Tax=Rotaria magnacalcarata TaxID=392030 RepID=A0A8S2UE46_9BILA|nr:unnamed protein product [Rotaria magnacalcarata]
MHAIPFSNYGSYAADWRYHLLATATIIEPCRSVDDVIHTDLNRIWYDSLTSTLETIDRTMMNRDVIEIPLFFNVRFPCATTEYGIIRQFVILQ